MDTRKRVYLSPPHLSGRELAFVQDAIASNWIAPLGPHVDAFEREMASLVGVGHAAALSSGTAALHLAIRLLGLERGEEVVCPTFTFIASVGPIVLEGGRPVFLDVSPETWTLAPELLEEELVSARREGRRIRAVVAVDLYGQCADYGRIAELCRREGIALIEDAAEALGATYGGRPAGSLGDVGILSFNGNKIITASTGGMLVSNDAALVARARHLSTQAREPAPHYEHREIGFNYRMSNIVAAIGRAQLEVLADRVRARREVFDAYRVGLGDLPGISFMPEAAYGRSNRWLTCMMIDPAVACATADDVRRALDAQNIEARPLWKPMHRQPVFSAARCRGGRVAERLFATGICLPSGSSLALEDRTRIIDIIRHLVSP